MKACQLIVTLAPRPDAELAGGPPLQLSVSAAWIDMAPDPNPQPCNDAALKMKMLEQAREIVMANEVGFNPPLIDRASLVVSPMPGNRPQ